MINSTLTRRQAWTGAVAAVSIAALLAPSFAWADLMLYPTRIVIGSKQRSAQVEIVNRGDKTETYRINIINRRMTDDGQIVEAKDVQPGEQFANTMLIYTPSQVTLKPGQSQTVRVSVRRPEGLADGEYRSHLQFDRVADQTADTDITAAAKPEKGQVAITLQALIGASIPVIVRQGQTSATVTMDDLALVPGAEGKAPAVRFVFHRQGNQSVYGDIVAHYAPDHGKAVEIGKVAGVAVYVPNATRKEQLPLTLPTGTSLHGGKLTVRFNERADAGGKLIAEATLDIP